MKIRLPAVERHCIAKFIFLFFNCLWLNRCRLTAIDEFDSLGLRRQKMENCEGRENSITLSLSEFSHWHLRDSLGEMPCLRTPTWLFGPLLGHFLDFQLGHLAQDQNYLGRVFSPHKFPHSCSQLPNNNGKVRPLFLVEPGVKATGNLREKLCRQNKQI